jgi:hypothetical protein
MPYATVPFGRFFGCTASELRTRLDTLRAAILAAPAGGVGSISSASVNGRSFTYDLRGRSAESELADLVEALSLVDDAVMSLPTEQTFAAQPPPPPPTYD